MKRIEVYVYYDKNRGYVFASDTIFAGKVLHTIVNPIMFLSVQKANDELVGEYTRKALDVSRYADPVNKDIVGDYKFWNDIGIKSYSKFCKSFNCMEIEEIDNKLFYRKFLHMPRGGYVGACKEQDRDSVSISISNEELGKLVQRDIS